MTTTYTIERVADHGRTDAKGQRYSRQATTIATTTDPAKVTELRAAAKAQIEPGSSDWIEVR